MTTISAHRFLPFIKISRWLLLAGLIVSFIAIVILTRFAPQYIFLLPFLIGGGIIVWKLFQHPEINLVFTLLLFSFITMTGEGVSKMEYAVGSYTLAFLAHWFLTGFIKNDRFIKGSLDFIFASFFIWILVTTILSILNGALLSRIINELIGMFFLLLYFPIKEIVSKKDHGIFLLIGVLALQGMYVLARNITIYIDQITNATFVWQLEKGRVTSNEHILLIAIFVMAVWTGYQTTNLRKIFAFIGFILMLLGLIATQSRGYWIDFALGMLLLMWVADNSARLKMLLLLVIGLIILSISGQLLFGKSFDLIVIGLIERFLSLGTAVTHDVSLVQRFREAESVWERVWDSPFVGHGIGVTYISFDLNVMRTRIASFVHNGYVALFFKYGLIGFLLLMTFWFKSIRAMFLYKQYRAGNASLPYYREALILFISISSLLPSMSTSTLFFRKDSVFTLTALAGTIAGVDVFLKSKLKNIPDVS